MPVTGLLSINKPAGITSRDVVNRVVRLVKPAKVGHAGTLDPLATGVLIVCIGGATRLIEYVQRMSKRYRATFLLGRESPTEDLEGPVRELDHPPQPQLDEIEAALPNFIGEIMQRPPAYSALKVSGQRAYELARAGQDFDLVPRPIVIHDLQLLRYEYPEVSLAIHCGSGTYVRSLGRDLAESLGTAAVMSSLTRTAIGEFALQNAVNLDRLNRESLPEFLLPARTGVSMLPTLEVSAMEVQRISRGMPIERPEIGSVRNASEIAAVDERGHLVAILLPTGDRQFAPRRVFPEV